MPPVTERQLKILSPYLVGEGPTTRGEDQHKEWDMFCPLHEDSQRSAGVNLDAGVWNCLADCGGGTVRELIKQKEDWVAPPTGGAHGATPGRVTKKGNTQHISDEMVSAWVNTLHADKDNLTALKNRRGLTTATISRYEIGWDRAQQAYTIPIRDALGELVNVRWYSLNPKEGRRKIWSANGHGAPVLYPIDIFSDNPARIVICEGEWDALLSIQNGVPAITRTGSAKTWRAEWGEHFVGRTVYLCHDMDHAGQEANSKISKTLAKAAKEVWKILLPYEVTPDHGKDLTDFWEEHTKRDFNKLIRAAVQGEADGRPQPAETDPADASVLDSFDARNVGEPLKLTVTIKGKKTPGYSVPREAQLKCSRDAGDKCNICPLHAAQGDDVLVVEPSDPVILDMVESPKGKVIDQLREEYGAPKCNRLKIEATEYQSVEVLFARPSVEHSSGNGDGYTSVKLTSAGRHDTQPNNTVEVVGALYPDPRAHRNEFLVWDVKGLETALDRFEPDEKTHALLARFQPRKTQRPLKKLGEISRQMASHVTHIYGRPEMHALMDLTWHSVLAFNFDGKLIHKGWMDTIVVGDTRTGKSEAASKLANHYGAGEVVSCESASFAGIIGGLQQYGSSNEWAINWGAVPINDRRLVVLDEVSGLKTEEIGSMSSVRSSGVAELTKIQQDRTHARTRLLWLGNPRDAKMGDFTYGVQALKPLIGNAEDIARFDLAMSVRAGEVPPEEINRSHAEGRLRYTAEACSMLVRWAWSRTVDHVQWGPGATDAVYACATALGGRYTEDPPLVQVANIRIKLARIAVALAARLYSTPDGETLLVTRDHVEDAMKFIDMIYGMQSFGYAEQSSEAIQDRKDAISQRDNVAVYLLNQPGLGKFLRGNSKFRRQDIEEVLSVTREEANGVITQLYRARMVRKDKGDVKIEPALHELLRELK